MADYDPPLTESETLSLRMHLLEREVRELKADVRTGNESVAELVELFRGAKALVFAARIAGSITIKFSAFVVAMAAMVAAIKLWMFGGRP